MGRSATVTEEQLDWMRSYYSRMDEQAHRKLRDGEKELTYAEMARTIGYCVDTLKRILMRNQIATYHSEKFAVCYSRKSTTWTRPCMRCKSTKPRPKQKYICDKCKCELNWTDDC